ncbi:unnamed protein product [Rotaria socialis]|uniref:Uncharacterized protein n=1 Tax=Rotaria socialis TaxID=392032 RepID=A0A818S2T3_9BILA|nr:unnamed protein product [Rotaria socialis]CAF4566490.1 unnamed protein product [Rotaria socialis]
MAMANYSQTSNTLEECSICLSPLAQQSIDNIQARNNVCPLCRARLDSLVDILNGPVTATGSVLTQNIPTPILTRTLIPLTVRKTGIWAKLTKPITNAFKRGSNKNACTCCRDYRAFPSLNFSDFSLSQDSIDEEDVCYSSIQSYHCWPTAMHRRPH